MNTVFDVRSRAAARDRCEEKKTVVKTRAAAHRWTRFALGCAFALGCVATASAGDAWEADWPAAAASAAASTRAGESWESNRSTATYGPDAGVSTVDVSNFERWTDPDLSLETLDALRREAQAGDVEAAIALVSRLVDRYERGGATDELFEAVVWIDRYHGSERLANSGVIARVQQRDCANRVLRLHWLCDMGE